MKPQTTSAPRLTAPDNVRGLIMAIMAIDHVSLFIAHRHSGEFWRGNWTQYTSAALFLTRFITHLCAPGFFFLMGLGMYLFAHSRREQGWTEPRIIGYFAKRGALLILLNVLVEIWLWKLGTAFQHHEGAQRRLRSQDANANGQAGPKGERRGSRESIRNGHRGDAPDSTSLHPGYGAASSFSTTSSTLTRSITPGYSILVPQGISDAGLCRYLRAAAS